MARNASARRVARRFRKQAMKARDILVGGIASTIPQTKANLKAHSPVGKTGKLSSGWRHRKLKTGVKYRNIVSYAKYDQWDQKPGSRFKTFWNDIKGNALNGAKSVKNQLGSLGANYGR
jgi:hypothetical protein